MRDLVDVSEHKFLFIHTQIHILCKTALRCILGQKTVAIYLTVCYN